MVPSQLLLKSRNCTSVALSSNPPPPSINETAREERQMKLREILRDETCWTKRNMAIDKNGLPVSPMSEKACQFCLEGAALKSDFVNRREIKDKLILAAKSLGFHCPWLANFNDHPDVNFADVCKVIELAGV